MTQWFSRAGEQAFSIAFGDPYPIPPTNYGFTNAPVFLAPQEGDRVSLSAVSVAPDGAVWFSGNAFHAGDPSYGVAMWDGHRFHYYDPGRELGMAENNVQDLIALPDGRLVLAGAHSGLVFWDPISHAHQSVTAGSGLPDNDVNRLELDRMVTPPTLHVSTRTGATALRRLP